MDEFAVEEGVDMLPQHLLNKANRDLTAQIAHFEKESENVQREIDEHKQRLKFMVEHLSNVKAEILNTQQLHEGKRREIETEDHLAQLAERENGRLKAAHVKALQLQQDMQDQIDSVQNRIFQANLRMDEFKAAMNYNQEELEQWDLARRQKEDDGVALAKYSKADEAKSKALTLQIEKLSQAVQLKRDELEEEITDTRAAQIELDKTAEDFKQVHSERQHLMRQWTEAVKAMHSRDKAIEAAGQRYDEGAQWLEKRQKQLKNRAEFHQVENANNKDTQLKIEQEERVLSKYREDHTVLEKHICDLDDEVEVLRNTLAKAARDKNNLATEKDEAQKTLAQRQAQFNRMQLQHEAVVHKLEDEVAAASDLERQNKLVADLLTETERSMKQLDKETGRIKDEQYHASQELFSVRRQQATYLAEMSGAQAQGRNMAAKISQLDGESFKQQELLYTIEFNVQQMERKVNRAKGERTEEEKRELQEKIEMLQKMLDDLLKQHKVLDVQVTRVQEELRQGKQETTQLEKDKRRVTEELLELTLENESCEIELGGMTKVKEEQLVASDVLKLQVESLRRLLQRRGSELLGLENRRSQLDITIAERELEIKVHHDVLKMESKVAEDERAALATELQQRLKTVEHLKNRYGVLMGRMDSSAAETTQAQHIVRTAKEREELQATGDALDSEIKRVERESRKLDKTISLIKSSNVKFKHQFTKVGEGDDDLVQQKLLSTKGKELQGIINRRAHDAKEFMRTEMAKIADLQERQRERDEVAQRIKVMQDGEVGLQRDVDEQRELIAKYDVAISKARRQTEAEIVEDILLREDQEGLNSHLNMLLSAASSYGGISAATTTAADGGAQENAAMAALIDALERHGVPVNDDSRRGAEADDGAEEDVE